MAYDLEEQESLDQLKAWWAMQAFLPCHYVMEVVLSLLAAVND